MIRALLLHPNGGVGIRRLQGCPRVTYQKSHTFKVKYSVFGQFSWIKVSFVQLTLVLDLVARLNLLYTHIHTHITTIVYTLKKGGYFII